MVTTPLPIPKDIRANGKVAQLVLKPRRSYNCFECGLLIEVAEPHYLITYSGAGLSSIKFPERVCVACLSLSLSKNGFQHIKLREVWGGLFDYCYANIKELEQARRMRGLVICLQKIWRNLPERACSYD